MTKAQSEQESQRRRMQAELDAARTAKERNAAGQFATPPNLATEIAQVALEMFGKGKPIRFLDPAIGTGGLFSALLRAARPSRVKSAQGVELDPRFADAARSLWGTFGLEVTCGDFTKLAPPDRPEIRANLLLANPPYVRHHYLAQDEKTRLRREAAEVLGAPVSGLAGLYVHFLLLSHRWLTEDAISAWIIPSEWMDVNYGSALRKYLCEKVTLLRVHRFDAADVQFTDALVSSSVVFFRKRAPVSGSTCLLTTGGSLGAPRSNTTVAMDQLASSRKWGQIFAEAHPVVPLVVGKRTVLLGDLLDVKRGVATGANDFFIRPRAEFRELGIPERFLRPIVPSSRELVATVIERAPDGYPVLETPLALLDCAMPEEQLRREYPATWAYLDSEAGRAARTGYLTRNRKLWYAQEQRPHAPFLATYMGRGRAGGNPFRFFWNRSEATATNTFLLLIPKDRLAAVLQRTPEAGRLVHDFLCGVARAELVRLGRVYGGGLHKLEPKELASLDASELVAALELHPVSAGRQGHLPFDVPTTPAQQAGRRASETRVSARVAVVRRSQR